MFINKENKIILFIFSLFPFFLISGKFLPELGVLGYIFIFSFFAYLIFIFFKNFLNILFKNKKTSENNYNLYKIFILLALIQHLFPIIPSGNIFNNWLSVLFYFDLAFLLNFHYYNKK